MTSGHVSDEIRDSLPSGNGPRVESSSLVPIISQSLRPYLLGANEPMPCSTTPKRHDADDETVLSLDIDLGKCVERANAGEAMMRDMTRGISGRIRGENVYECRARGKKTLPFSMAPVTKCRFAARLRRDESLPKDLGGGKRQRESYTTCTAAGDCDYIDVTKKYLLRATFRGAHVTVTVGGWHGTGKRGRTLALPMKRGSETQLVELRLSN